MQNITWFKSECCVMEMNMEKTKVTRISSQYRAR